MKPSLETEVKLAVRSLPAIRSALRAQGFAVSARRTMEQNAALDDPARRLRTSGLLLRVRRTGKTITCTYKGPVRKGLFKQREEHEFTASDFDACLALFAGIGFAPNFLYEKYRTEFRRASGPGCIMLDETPIGNFIELEGPPDWIDLTATQLGFSRLDYITASYWTLYLAHCAAFDVKPTNMVFPNK